MDRRTVNRRYRIDRKIGEGGMAEVFLGHDGMLHRPVAIKSLRPQYAADPSFRMRFEREAQAAAGFTHPNIIDVYDVGEDRGTPYIVMEYMPGETLKEIIANEGPFDPDDVAILVEQVAAALDYAHQRGFVHRDVKPQNILVDAEGLAKVVDFGIAKGLADSTLTDAGSGLGTVHYVSPEQASGLMATPSSDIYSLAVVAYEMLTGQLPFDSDSPIGIAMQHINEQPPHPSTVNPEVPRQAGDIVMRALAKDPTRRFPNAGDFARALSAWRSYSVQGMKAARAAAAATTWVPRAEDAARPLSPPTPEPKAVAEPRRSMPPGGLPTAGTAPPAPAPTRREATETKAASIGCATWVVGLAVLGVLVALVWLGARLSPRLGGLGSGPDPTPTIAAGQALPITTPTIAAVQGVSVLTPTPRIIAKPTPANQQVAVPDLGGKTLDEATAALRSVGLTIQQMGTVASDSVGQGKVAAQEPAPQTAVAEGASVAVTLSSGPASVDLQALHLSGMDANQAEQTLTSRSLLVTRQEVGNARVPAGAVVDTQPADRARPGDNVTLRVSVGNKVQIPREIQGEPLAKAIARLEGAGITVANQVGVSARTIQQAGIKDLQAAGIVDHDVVGIQDNGAEFGAWVAPGTRVTLVFYDHTQDGG